MKQKGRGNRAEARGDAMFVCYAADLRSPFLAWAMGDCSGVCNSVFG
ncbi:hypothetical protein LMG22931_02079 [Paraburkholderia nemoris]|nr:hypothetical protein LMG22931_02079 [Paraburkholderia nemoris]